MSKQAQQKSEAFKEVEAELARWRRTRKVRTAIPEEIWSLVESLHPAMSIYKISKGLGLNYTAVKKRVEEAERQGSATPGFVEIKQMHGGDILGKKMLRVELSSADGGRISFEYAQGETAVLIRLAETLWGRKTCCN